MNIYLYEGPNRLAALTSVVEGNGRIGAGTAASGEGDDSAIYKVPLHSSFLLVAYPEANIDATKFQFAYWAEAQVHIPESKDPV